MNKTYCIKIFYNNTIFKNNMQVLSIDFGSVLLYNF